MSDPRPGVKLDAESLLNGNGIDQPSTTEPVTPVQSYSSLPKDPPVYTRDDLFYEDHKIFLVENHLFRVPINDLAVESPIFRTMIEVPAPSDGEGSSDNNPIRLDGVLRHDFRQLLRVLCPPKRFNAPAPTLSFPEWISVLKLADMWCMDDVKEHAISNMSALPNLDPVDKIVVARQYNIQSWLIPCFNQILQRSQSYTERDVKDLGLETFLLLVDFRDRLTFGNGGFGVTRLSAQRQAITVDFTQILIAELPDFRNTAILPEFTENEAKMGVMEFFTPAAKPFDILSPKIDPSPLSPRGRGKRGKPA